jgi:hypothetical protein
MGEKSIPENSPEITPEMIAAGIGEWELVTIVEGEAYLPEELVERIYRAMRKFRR